MPINSTNDASANTLRPKQPGDRYIYAGGKKGKYRETTTQVGSFPANKFGLHDMHGNVWEWCQDVWHKNYEGAPTDGRAWMTGGNQERRIIRGGSWSSYPRACRSACRGINNPGYRNDSFGFRVMCLAP